MAKIIKFGRRERLDFSKIPAVMDLPDLISIQRDAYDQFLQLDCEPDKRESVGLQKAFNEVFPICDFHGNPILEFLGYNIGEPKYDIIECYERDMTYSAPLRIKVRLIVREESKDGVPGQIRNVKEQEVYMGEIPLMSEQGAFIVNGAARVIVSQLHRSPGVAFSVEKESAPGKKLYTARVIPYRGTWLSFEVDSKDILYARINRKRKFLGTILLRSMGFSSNEEILNLFLNYQEVGLGKRKKDIIGQTVYEDVVDAETGEVIIEKGEAITEDILHALKQANIDRVKLLVAADSEGVLTIKNSLEKDKCKSTEEALIEIYKKIRPGEPPTLESARSLLERMFFDPKRYDLSKVGRYKLNKKLSLDVPITQTALRREDIVEIVKYLINLQQGIGSVGDIDHLGNRRVRTVGELLEIQIQMGLARMERTIKERINTQDIDKLMPSNLINAKPMMAAVKDFFGSSQLSQFMDQTNPLSELTHKRRLSALGPDGLSRERAGFEVRDVHHTHYGRICPIETPEGPNIGLIVSMSTYAKINNYGFLETAYRKVKNGRVTEQIEYLSADLEDDHIIAQANAKLDEQGNFVAPVIVARHKGDFPQVSPDEVDYMDVSPKQLVSVATALIPFLEHDDANRALMGSNMQRQAVPLLTSEAPLVGTGIEYRSAIDSGVVVTAKRSGVVEYVSATKIIVRVAEEEEAYTFDNTDVYILQKYRRSNQDTWINQIPIVREGDKVAKGEALADGPSTDMGELALGKNLVVAFMPWGGYNFEDAILMSEKVVRANKFTSVHVEEFEVEARDIKLGREEITRDIPNVGEDSLRNLDEHGIIRIGAEVEPGDILVGKVTPKGETELSPEERLLKAIFGEKAESVRDTSLRCGPSDRGIVVDVKIFSRTEKDKDEATKKREDVEKKKIEHEFDMHRKMLEKRRGEYLKSLLSKAKAPENIKDKKDNLLIAKGKVFTDKIIEKLTSDILRPLISLFGDLAPVLQKIETNFERKLARLQQKRTKNLDRVKKGDELPPGVIKVVKVYLAKRRRLSVGDKMAGRHGNKGVIAKILPEEDMPYLADGTTVDIILNPLGVPSRMNVGQILETHLGWAAHVMNRFVSTGVFDGATEKEIKELLKEAGLPEDGRVVLYDGRTGDPFDQKVTVGNIYMMKLAHLVDDKIHARSIGPYSLVTQQPLGGKAQFGGQRLGEMEVWALEAYGAAYTLREFLTVKSDDVSGRTAMYEAIVRGENKLLAGIPESFNVLEKELRGLCLNLEREKGQIREEDEEFGEDSILAEVGSSEGVASNE